MLERTLADIDRNLRARLDVRPPGLLDGVCGEALFYAYYYELTGDEAHLEVVHRIVEQLLDRPSGLASHCSGLAGIAWCLDHLIARGLLDPGGSKDALFAPIDRKLAAAVAADLAAGRRDFLHDSVGALLYFRARLPAEPARACLASAIVTLARSSITDEHGTRWPNHVDRPGPPIYDLGLAHGIAGIVSLACVALSAGIETERAAGMIAGAVRWMRSTRRDGASRFPVAVDRDGGAIGPATTRLGWCYGDLAVAIAFAHAGARLGDRALQAEAHELMHHVLASRTVDDGKVVDAALCHGAMGIAQIYRREFLATGDHAFRQGADRWLQLGLTLPTGEDDGGILQGSPGIGLAIIAALGPPEASDWDRCLLLS